MPKRRFVRADAGSHYEPFCAATFLPGCAGCGAPHPLAHRHPVESETCPGCGAPVQPPAPTRMTRAKFTGGGVAGAFVRLCFWAGAQLLKIARRL